MQAVVFFSTVIVTLEKALAMTNCDFSLVKKQLSLAKSKNATSQKAYFKNLLNAQKQLSKDNPVIPLCTEVEDHLVNSNLRGVLWNTTGTADYTRAYFK